MNLLKLLGLGAVLALSTAAGRADDADDLKKKLVGKWEVTKAAPGTVPEGALIEFTKDGKLKITAKKGGEDVTLDGTYTTEKGAFTMTMKLGDMERTQKITVTKITDKEMSTKDKDDKVVELKKK